MKMGYCYYQILMRLHHFLFIIKHMGLNNHHWEVYWKQPNTPLVCKDRNNWSPNRRKEDRNRSILEKCGKRRAFRGKGLKDDMSCNCCKNAFYGIFFIHTKILIISFNRWRIVHPCDLRIYTIVVHWYTCVILIKSYILHPFW